MASRKLTGALNSSAGLFVMALGAKLSGQPMLESGVAVRREMEDLHCLMPSVPADCSLVVAGESFAVVSALSAMLLSSYDCSLVDMLIRECIAKVFGRAMKDLRRRLSRCDHAESRVYTLFT